MQKIMTHLWFDDQAEEAARFYTSIFGDSRIVEVTDYGRTAPGTAVTILAVTFELAGQRYIALNAGPAFTFNEAVSLYVDCADQEEVDYYWSRLLEGGGEAVQCGWLKDRYGLSWQVVPRTLTDLMADPDPERAGRAFEAMMGMVKLDAAELQAAADGTA
ncbi:VOC family protein [Streptomonospora salina]|uniref:Putative 3-demethylubiquinone-9 3-methyltransferase (Glyoxalase superfamily) n=1 Tax=Streptomonospora salina TaxID=104205 RepID=A0A841EH32_9ACTN|nr:VOC family protein [Streptomonospora salina]MBB6000679.1 putative 3-demethylubiquinone-9 3-methyltransferase (glyoxalase superfamily) [Streptomonospora salina]